ncbi:Rossmann-like and DUF2520 domain-containing protein [Dinghuibacter silviterrae]|uniref:Putative short-subunit dehydrogenase-like oxidoreductase (DUF2520 family) n=1 Tax=Dinghuibacter silviterrae TaxID=1539049 RepID=A0A4R8DX21_9BACT|nr:DUF2520 domain-containing protein [Dinghuibacter silviterrae]TDX01761.1 putative short-subunit dehydrogenase-like oxidoreductase (DUF2520 family) [Dinghuibacter silviterrae]
MTITLIGSGNVATVLGKRLQRAGHTILQVCSPRNAEALGAALRAEARKGEAPNAAPEAIQDPKNLKKADLYLVAVSDTAVKDVAGQIRVADALVVHTAGSVPLDVLKEASKRYGVLYPLQSLRKETDPDIIPLLVDGSDEDVRSIVEGVAKTISPMVKRCNDAERLFFHIGGVLVNNFPNYLYTQTDLFLQDKGQSIDMLLPLMAETVRRLKDFPPAEVQTGPAVRGDEATIRKHQEQLEGYPELLEWYNAFTNKIRSFYARKYGVHP